MSRHPAGVAYRDWDHGPLSGPLSASYHPLIAKSKSNVEWQPIHSCHHNKLQFWGRTASSAYWILWEEHSENQPISPSLNLSGKDVLLPLAATADRAGVFRSPIQAGSGKGTALLPLPPLRACLRSLYQEYQKTPDSNMQLVLPCSNQEG
jgi:hypothetical protein